MIRRLAATLLVFSVTTVRADPPPEIESALLPALNAARTTPRSTIPALEALLPQFHGTVLIRESRPDLVTVEGASALREAIDFLRQANGCPALRLEPGLSGAARELVQLQRDDGAVGHATQPGLRLEERVNRHGVWLEHLGENIEYGADNAEEAVRQMIVDDGVPARGHRRALFDCSYRVAGLACGTHPRYRSFCVVIFAGEFKPH